MSEKIKITLDDINSSQVDENIKRQDMLHRMQEHQQTVANNAPPSQIIQSGKGGFFRKAFVYMTLFGLISSFVGWGFGEALQYLERTNDWYIARPAYQGYLYLKEQGAESWQISSYFNAIKQEPLFRNNPYFDSDMTAEKFETMRKSDELKLVIYNILWYIFVAVWIAIGLSVAESVVEFNWVKTLQNLALALLIASVGAFIISLFLDRIYVFLLGDNPNFVQQVFARTVGWGLLGLFVSVTPGILMRSWKKLLLGLLGGLIGGIIGGLLFDIVCEVAKTDILSRCIGVVAFGTLSGVATAFLENVAKQGWLKIKAGLIAGKQFIIYKNPTTIGSSPKCDVYLFKDTSIAGIHAAIHLQNGNYILCSQIGALTYVNNQIVQEYRLNNGDIIQIGQTVIQFEAKKIQNNY